jgi:lysophospholipase L1-like esterase
MFPEKHLTRPKQKHVNFREILLHLSSLVFVALLAGCGGQTETTVTPATSVTTSIRTAPTVIAERGDEEWDYVALGDSITWGFIDQYAEMLEQDLGVKVNLRDRTAGGDHSSLLLERLRTDPDLRQALREAEVITFEIPWNVVKGPWQTYEGLIPGDCGGADNQDCLRAAFDTYKADTDAIIAEIVSLRNPSEALIRTMDTYQFWVRESKEKGTFDTLNRYWRDANEHVIEEAARYNIPAAASMTRSWERMAQKIRGIKV